MSVYMLILRLVHILAGVFWAGTVFFYAIFLLPRVKAAGPVGGQFMQKLSQPPLPASLSAAGGLVVLSGILMYWRDSGGFQATWIRTFPGLALTIGGLAGLTAIVLGVVVSRPAATRLGVLGKEVAGSGGPPSPAQQTEMQALAGRLEKAVYQTAYLLLIAAITMAVAGV